LPASCPVMVLSPLLAAIAPYEESREFVRNFSKNYCLIHTECSMEVLRERDPKGLYRRAFLPSSDSEHIPHFTGVSDPYEEPGNANLTVHTDTLSENEALEGILLTVMTYIGPTIHNYLLPVQPKPTLPQ